MGDKLPMGAMGFDGIGQSYFDGGREERLRRLMMGMKKERNDNYEEEMYRHHRYVVECYRKYVKGCYMRDELIEAYMEYLENGDMFEFEKRSLSCQYHISRSQYMDIMKSDNPVTRFVYSSLEYVVEGLVLRYQVHNQSYLVSPKGSNLVRSIIPPDAQISLNTVGVVSKQVPYPMREVKNDGQIKIFTDLFKLAQNVEQTSQRVLIVGSSSQSSGGSHSYDLLEEMFQDSVFDLYDPYEMNDSYKGKNGNVYNRHASAFKYSPEVAKYDLVQDDAYAAEVDNRSRIDPEGYLFEAPNFSCKCLLGDEEYFKQMHPREITTNCCMGCVREGSCYKDKFKGVPEAGVRQVGRVATMERRVMSFVPLIGRYRDERFGTCSFCREMYYYCNHVYGDEFFSKLAGIHSIGSRCSIKKRFVVPRSDGSVEHLGRKYHVVKEIVNGVCLPYDPVLDFPIVKNLVYTSSKTYVFSTPDKIKFHEFCAKVAIYDDRANVFFVNYLDEDFCQSDVYDRIVNGLRFRYVGNNESDCLGGERFKVSFNGDPSRIPIIDKESTDNRSYGYMLDVARYYGQFYLNCDGEYFVLV